MVIPGSLLKALTYLVTSPDQDPPSTAVFTTCASIPVEAELMGKPFHTIQQPGASEWPMKNGRAVRKLPFVRGALVHNPDPDPLDMTDHPTPHDCTEVSTLI